MLTEKCTWTDDDFLAMSWHDCRLYSINLPRDDFSFLLDIDYIFKWECSGETINGFWISPCDLKFENVTDLKIEIDNKNYMTHSIMNIQKTNPRLTGMVTSWDYLIELERGYIAFSASNFIQSVRRSPILSANQDLNDR